MERRIGEIFEHNGEWYQCIKGISCKECDFSTNNITCDINGRISCTRKGRSDDTSVIFKKLEKVGEPYNNNGKLVQNYKLYIPVYGINEDEINSIIPIEIKQNKEDMEEKKVIFGKLACKYINGKITYEAFEKGVIELFNNKGESKPTLKEFDLESAKAGKPVCTRDGRKARIICFDRKFTDGDYNYHILALVDDGEDEYVYSYTDDGLISKHEENSLDLMMLPEKKEGWVNVYRGQVYNSLEIAERAVDYEDNFLKTIKIDWEE